MSSLSATVAAMTPIAVNLPKNATTYVVLGAPAPTHGSIIVVVRSNSSTGAAATFQITRTVAGISLARLTHCAGSNGEGLMMRWELDTRPELRFNPAPGGAGTAAYKCTVVYVQDG